MNIINIQIKQGYVPKINNVPLGTIIELEINSSKPGQPGTKYTFTNKCGKVNTTCYIGFKY